MPGKDQIFMFNDLELSLIKNTFSDNDVLLHSIRKVLLQFPLSDVERGLLKTTMTPELIAVLKKRINPDIGPEYPLGQLPSLLTTLTDNLKVMSPEEMFVHFESKQLQLDYFNQQFAVLAGATDEPIKLAELSVLKGKDNTTRAIHLNTYLFILGYVDPMLIMIKNMAGTKEETPEEQKKRMTRNSSK